MVFGETIAGPGLICPFDRYSGRLCWRSATIGRDGPDAAADLADGYSDATGGSQKKDKSIIRE